MLCEDINLSQMFLCTNFIIITSLHVDCDEQNRIRKDWGLWSLTSAEVGLWYDQGLF